MSSGRTADLWERTWNTKVNQQNENLEDIMTRDEWVWVYLTPKEKERFANYGEQVGLALSTTIRNLALRQLRQEEKG